ncbi:MAG: tetratricopeptide repeat protein [Armatimonadota bacterium]
MRFSLFLLILLLGTTLVARAEDVSPQRLLLLRGALALADGQAAQAVSDLSIVATFYPEDWRCQLLYGQALLLDKQSLQAKAQLRRTVLLAPNNPDAWRALADAGRVQDDPHLELAGIAGFMRICPEDPPMLARAAALYRAVGQEAVAVKFENAFLASFPALDLNAGYLAKYRATGLEELRHLAGDEPANAGVLAALACEEWNAENRDAARIILRKLRELAPNDTTVVNNYIHVCLKTGSFDEAIAVMKEVSVKGVLYPLNRILAQWSVSRGRPADAIEPLQRQLLLNPADAALNRQLGVAARLAGQYDLAVSALRIAYLRDPNHLIAQQYAAALYADGNVKHAEDILKQGKMRFPRESMLGVTLAALYRDTDRLQESAKLALDLVAARPEKVELTMLAGERYFKAGMIGAASNLAYTLRDTYPSDAVAIHSAVTLLRRLGAYSEARLAMTRYLSPNAKSPLKASEIILEVAGFEAEENRLPEATSALESLVQRDPKCRGAYQALGKLYLQQERWKDAISIYSAALDRWQDDGEFALGLARAARQAGNHPLAVRAYRQAAGLMRTAVPWIELGYTYLTSGDIAMARECWRTAQNLPQGKIRAKFCLLANYRDAGETDNARELLKALAAELPLEREAYILRWREQLTAAGLAPTTDELHALLDLAPDLVSFASLDTVKEQLLAREK